MRSWRDGLFCTENEGIKRERTMEMEVSEMVVKVYVEVVLTSKHY